MSRVGWLDGAIVCWLHGRYKCEAIVLVGGRLMLGRMIISDVDPLTILEIVVLVVLLLGLHHDRVHGRAVDSMSRELSLRIDVPGLVVQ